MPFQSAQLAGAEIYIQAFLREGVGSVQLLFFFFFFFSNRSSISKKDQKIHFTKELATWPF